MLVLSLLLFVLAIGLLAAAIWLGRPLGKFLKIGSGGVAGLALLVFLTCSYAVVPAGHVGVRVLFGRVDPSASLPPGFHLVNPLLHVEKMTVRTENYVMSASHEEGDKRGDDSVVALSSNGLRMPMDISIPYRLLEPAAPWVYQNFGPDYVAKLIRPAARTAVQRATVKFTDQECYSTRRDELAEMIKTLFEEEFNKLLVTYESPPKATISVSQVMIGSVTLPDMVRQAIEKKLKADQEQQEMDFRIAREEKEANRKEIEARGIQKFQEIVTKGIDDRLLRWKGIDATIQLAESPNSKLVIIGTGKDGLPVILGNVGEK